MQLTEAADSWASLYLLICKISTTKLSHKPLVRICIYKGLKVIITSSSDGNHCHWQVINVGSIERPLELYRLQIARSEQLQAHDFAMTESQKPLMSPANAVISSEKLIVTVIFEKCDPQVVKVSYTSAKRDCDNH